MSEPGNKELHVLVAGIKCTVFEREASEAEWVKRPQEWGMTLYYGSGAIAKVLSPDLQARIREIECDPYYEGGDRSIKHHNGKTGGLVFATPAENAKRVSRKKMRLLFREGLTIEYNEKLASLTSSLKDTVTTSFADGTTAAGSLVVGCDGANSIVRELLVGKKAAQVERPDIQMLNFTCRYSPETARLLREIHPIIYISYHPDGWMYFIAIQDVPDPDDANTWLFQNLLSWVGTPRKDDLGTREDRVAFLKEKSALFADPWRRAGLEAPDEPPLVVDRCSLWSPSMEWSSSALAGKVTIAGDAAHPMTPHRRQGLNNALEDAALLAEQLTAVHHGAKAQPEAMADYETEMKSRALREIPISLAQATMVHDWDKLMSVPMIRLGIQKAKQDAEMEESGSV